MDKKLNLIVANIILHELGVRYFVDPDSTRSIAVAYGRLCLDAQTQKQARRSSVDSSW